MLQLENLNLLIKQATKIVEKQLGKWELELDSANFQSSSKEECEKYRDAFTQKGLALVATLSHAGRQIYIYQVPEALKAKFNGISFVELSEPKPGKHFNKSFWEYASYLIPDYELFLDSLSKEGKLTKVREIEADKFCYYEPAGNTIQIRNRSVSKSDKLENINADSKVDTEVENSALEEALEAKRRLMADFDNYRRVTEMKIDKIRSNASHKIVTEIIEVLDDIDRAAENNDSDGLESVHAKLKHILKNEGIVDNGIQVGDKFDPMTMEALSTAPTANADEDNTVETIVQKGYLNENTGDIVRPTRVIVRKNTK